MHSTAAFVRAVRCEKPGAQVSRHRMDARSTAPAHTAALHSEKTFRGDEMRVCEVDAETTLRISILAERTSLQRTPSSTQPRTLLYIFIV